MASVPGNPTTLSAGSLSIDQVLRQAMASRENWTERQALALVADALRRNPREARLHQMEGLLHRALDQNDLALAALDRAAALASTDARIAFGRAQVRLDGGLDAREAFERAARLAPGNPELLLCHVAALMAVGEIEAADAMLAHGLAADPNWVNGHAALVRLRWQQGEGDAAWRSIEQALAQRPRELALWGELILGLMHAKKFDAALSAIARGRAACGPEMLFTSSEAGCRDELGDLEGAERCFMSIGRAADAGVALRFTRHLLHAHRPEDAVAVAEAWIGQPVAQHFWPYIATAWRITGDPRWEWLEGDERLVGVYDISDKIGPIDELAAHLRKLHQSVHQPLEQSLRGGTQTNGRLFARIDPIVQRLRRAIAETIAAHAEQLPPHDPRHPTLAARPSEIRFSGSWSVRLTGAGGHHATHIHPDGWYSSAFYVALPEDMDGEESQAGWLSLGDQPEFSDCPPAFKLVQPKAGKLCLFPSTMWHGTRPITGGERMTVAFDIALPPRPA